MGRKIEIAIFFTVSILLQMKTGICNMQTAIGKFSYPIGKISDFEIA